MRVNRLPHPWKKNIAKGGSYYNIQNHTKMELNSPNKIVFILWSFHDYIREKIYKTETKI